MFEIISLKTYWYGEKLNISSLEQNKHNEWIDEIIETKFNEYDSFTVDNKRLMIEYGDYLLISFDDNDNIVAFAVCCDYKPKTWQIWDTNQVFKKHGMIELSLICSKIPGAGSKLISELKIFATEILMRNSIEISVQNNQRLLKYYRNLKFKVKSKQKNSYTMALSLKN